MATGGLPRIESQYADIIIRGNYPELDETAYAARSTEQHANGVNAFQGAETVTQMAGNVAENMHGETATAADAQFTTRVANLTSQGATFENRSVSTALAGQNILNAKTEQNAAVAGFEAAWEAAKVQLVASGADQATLDHTYQTLVQEFQSQSDAAAANFASANSELNGQIKAGTEPSVPASMPSGAPGAGAPPLELPPEVMGQMQGLLGQGMGMAQSLPQSLQGLTGQAQGLVDPLIQAIQGAANGSGNVNVTPEMLDEMLAGQDTEGGSGSASSAPEAPSPEGFQGENSDTEPEKAEAEDTEPDDDGDDEAAGEDTEAAAPSPAASPVTAAPPASATVPETMLTADSLAELFS
ncbi:Uncharacterised protein [Mycobacteroides abscessus subsp. abscessus]|uniref:hypothetical protein n=1 Tax=Mycobacteroides abscessus TaxID=36809 RepID=UPI000928A9F0|nr:hypothetical protein [Mycobacteroides abscessus]SIC63087.1 Uncharacterised protein [Mycobacteroides abscessus subsp. abscessus]SIG63895.1 Uncharacterised protein [Mycobacteroides abscessus subsp. abscessus]